jgi:2-dehydropantoate 2-reductase
LTTNLKSFPQQIKIIGSGALGSLFAAFLEKHAEISMLSHWNEQIETVRSRGLTLLDQEGISTSHYLSITNNPSDLQPVQLALVLVKSYQTARAAYELAPIMAPDGLVITLQNGMGNLEVLQAVLGNGRVIQGVTAQGATMMGPGQVRHAGHGPTYLAQTPSKRRQVSDFVDLLNRAGLPAQITEDVKSLQWGKLAINTGINPLTAVLRVPNGYLVQHQAARLVMCAAAEETASVARKLEISLPYPDASARVTEVAEATAENLSSMLQDVLRGSPTEIDAINGAVANYGRQIGIPTPINDELWRRVREIQPGSPEESVVKSEKFLTNLLKKIE